MKATKGNMKDLILVSSNRILYCPSCGAEFSGNAGDYRNLPDDHVFICPDCEVEMELVHKITTIRYID